MRCCRARAATRIARWVLVGRSAVEASVAGHARKRGLAWSSWLSRRVIARPRVLGNSLPGVARKCRVGLKVLITRLLGAMMKPLN